MKLLLLSVCMVGVGCASARPLVISDSQRRLFSDMIRDAEAAGAADGPPEAKARLADAKSEFEYAQHLPQYPERARRLVIKAEEDAGVALRLAQRQAQERRAMVTEARRAADIASSAASADVPATTPAVAPSEPSAPTAAGTPSAASTTVADPAPVNTAL